MNKDKDTELKEKICLSHPCNICGEKIYIDNSVQDGERHLHLSCLKKEIKDAGRREGYNQALEDVKEKMYEYWDEVPPITKEDFNTLDIIIEELKDLTSAQLLKSTNESQIDTQTPQTDNISNEGQNSESIIGGTLLEESSSEGCGVCIFDDRTKGYLPCGALLGFPDDRILCDECKQKHEKKENE